MTSTYYRATGNLRKALLHLYRENIVAHERAEELAKSLGSDSHVWSGRWVSGFIFSSPPDKRLWCRINGVENGWRPRRIAANKLLLAQMDAIVIVTPGRVAAAIGLGKQTYCDGDNFYLASAGLRVKGNSAYVSVPTCFKVNSKELTRISDLTWERAGGAA